MMLGVAGNALYAGGTTDGDDRLANMGRASHKKKGKYLLLCTPTTHSNQINYAFDIFTVGQHTGCKNMGCH